MRKHGEKHTIDIKLAQAIFLLMRPFNAGNLLVASTFDNCEDVPTHFHEMTSLLCLVGRDLTTRGQLDYDLLRRFFVSSSDDDPLSFTMDMANCTENADYYHLDKVAETISTHFVQCFGLDLSIEGLSEGMRNNDENVLKKFGKLLRSKRHCGCYSDMMFDALDLIADDLGDIMIESDKQYSVNDDDDEMIQAVSALAGARYSMVKLATSFNAVVPVLFAALSGDGLLEFLEEICFLDIIGDYRKVGISEYGEINTAEELEKLLNENPEKFFYFEPDEKLHPQIAKLLYNDFYGTIERPKITPFMKMLAMVIALRAFGD